MTGMIKPLLLAVILPLGLTAMSTPLNALSGKDECEPVAKEYIDFSKCGSTCRIALAFEVAPTEALPNEQGDTLQNVKRENAEINLFPNPVIGDALYVEFRGEGVGEGHEVRVYNILGRDVIRQPLEQGKNLVNVGGLTEGIYFVDVVEKGKITRTVKLIRK